MSPSRRLTATALLVLLMLPPLVPSHAQDANFPPRRPGLWEVVTVTQKPEKVPKINARMCIDAATDREMMDFGLRMSKDTCARYEMRGKGSNWTVEAECTIGPVKTASRTRVSGDFQARVTMQIEGTTTGMPGTSGPQPMQMSQDSRWISADCPGMKVGDIMLDGGTKINVKDMRQLRKLLPNLQIR